ncbi:DUF1566 domain-containing protein [Leptospira langatensis]|uniref:DUF1566 domain-containing protein n=1 Tax=Leptospira langatensis TaxID=2484983 RepID=A0A5F1ZWH0_9LEPT|nr:DUF1566 domain-containing protein [Leptospira langatensis]TGJ98232.1 DUF1566 domain-containing protein [Leptospira langatensis]TGL43146.1 DUF1566 domain-containing protein [Leptospira langatensis]
MRIFNFIKLIVFLSLAFLGFVGCEEKIDHSRYGLASEDTSQLIAGAAFFENFTVNGDGTTTDSISGLTWKTCTQGQTFSGTASHYDCQGSAGSVTNPGTYGAKQLQYCSVNLESCNTLGIPQTLTAGSGASSEAYDSCASDGTAGGGWRVANFLELKYLSSNSRNFMILKFPNTIDDYYWSSTANEQDASGKTARAVSFSLSNFGDDESFTKITRYFVRCVR